MSRYRNIVVGAAVAGLIGSLTPLFAQTTSFRDYRCADGTEFIVANYPYDARIYLQIDGGPVTLKRRLFSGTASSLRRPSMPPHAVREAIQARWYEVRKGKEGEPVRAEDYEELHADFSQYTFATLWAVVHEFDNE